jgi:hypothetical protein
LVVVPGKTFGLTEYRILALFGQEPVTFGRHLFQCVARELQLPGAFSKKCGVTERKISQE